VVRTQLGDAIRLQRVPSQGARRWSAVLGMGVAIVVLAACGNDSGGGAADSPKHAAEDFANRLEAGGPPAFGADCPSLAGAGFTIGRPEKGEKRSIQISAAGKNRWVGMLLYVARDGDSSSIRLDVRRFGTRYEVCL
jgi:hypothetical protein